jgi:hypothetical protein
MLETFTIATFAGHLGETFDIHLASGTTLEVELIEVTSSAFGRYTTRRCRGTVSLSRSSSGAPSIPVSCRAYTQ